GVGGGLGRGEGAAAGPARLTERARRRLAGRPIPTGAAVGPPPAAGLPPPPLTPAPAEAATAVEEDSAEPRAIIRPSIRVNLDRLDALMNLVGELVIARSRLERRLSEFEHVNELPRLSRSRM